MRRGFMRRKKVEARRILTRAIEGGLFAREIVEGRSSRWVGEYAANEVLQGQFPMLQFGAAWKPDWSDPDVRWRCLTARAVKHWRRKARKVRK